jgi:rubrerythrin
VINSELSNDRFVTTIRQEHTAVDRKDCRKPVPGLGIDYHYVGLETSAEDLLRLHQEHIRQALSRAPQEQLLSFATFDEVRQSVSRMQSLLNRYAQPRLDRRTVIDRIQAAHPARSTTWCEEVYRQFELLRSCRQCGYDLLGNSGNICPECGAAVTAVVKTKVNEA